MTTTQIRKPSAEERFAEALRYYANGKEADRRFFEGRDEHRDADGRFRVEGRLAHEWLSLARVTASLAGTDLAAVRTAYALTYNA